MENRHSIFNINYWNIWVWWIVLTVFYSVGQISTGGFATHLGHLMATLGLFVPVGLITAFVMFLTPFLLIFLIIGVVAAAFVYRWTKRRNMHGIKLVAINLIALFVITFIVDLAYFLPYLGGEGSCFWLSWQIFMGHNSCITGMY